MEDLRSPQMGRMIVSFAVAAASTFAAMPIVAADAIAVADDEVFFDHSSGNFSSKLTAAAGKASKIALVARANSTVTVSYWEQPETGCGSAVPTGATSRAAAPAGPEVGGKQKYVTNLGPLRYPKRYCVQAVVVSRIALLPDEKVLVDQALDAALEDAVTNPPGDAPECQRSSGAATKVCSIGRAFEQRLGWDAARLPVLLPGTDEAIAPGKAFEQLAAGNEKLRDALARVLQEGENERSSRESAHEILDLLAAPSTWNQGDELVFDPLSAIDPEAITYLVGAQKRTGSFADSLTDAELKKRFSDAVLKDRSAFLDLVWETRVKLAQEKKRRPLDGDAEAQLKKILEHEGPAPKLIKLERVHYFTLAREGKRLDAGKLSERASSETTRLPSAEGLSKMPGFDRQKHAALAALATDIKALAEVASAWKEALARRTARLRDLPGWNAFKESMRSVTRTTAAASDVKNLPDFKDRFSFYVTADLGVAGLLMHGDETRGDFAPFFGLAFYFAPLDKDLPLKGVEFSRRFSLTAGISLTEPSAGGDAEVTGLLGDRAVLLGAGLRMTDYMRLAAGALLYRQESSNPLSDRTYVRAGGYTALSLDIDVIDVVKGWYEKAAE